MLTLWLWPQFPFPPVRSSGEVGWGPRTQRLTSVISGSRGRSGPWKDVSPASLYESGREHKKLEQVGPGYPLQPCLPTGLPSTPPPLHAKLQKIPLSGMPFVHSLSQTLSSMHPLCLLLLSGILPWAEIVHYIVSKAGAALLMGSTPPAQDLARGWCRFGSL